MHPRQESLESLIRIGDPWCSKIARVAIAFVANACLAVSGPVRAAGVVEEIAFESGSVGTFGTPASTGWQFDERNIISRIDTANVNRPTFTNGTNQEALLINPYKLGQSDADRQNQGALWNRSQDAGAGAAETFDAGEVLFVITETYSDVDESGQRWKHTANVGFCGDCDLNTGGVLPPPGFPVGQGGAFDTVAPTLGATWTWGGSDDGSNAKGSATSGVGDDVLFFNGLRYVGDEDLDGDESSEQTALSQNHIGIQVLRHGVDAGTPFTGTELEISDALGTFNGGDATNATDPDWGGASADFVGLVIDKVTVSISRARSQAPNNDGLDGLSPWLDPDELDESEADSARNAEMGLKYLKVGTASMLDVNLDGTVDAADELIVMTNQGMGTAEGGDYNGDGVVDAADYSIYRETEGDTGPLGTLPADGDDGSGTGTPDGVVDINDYNFWGMNLGGSTRRATFFDGDIDNDLDVDADDLAFFGSSTGVPEPAGAGLLCLAWLGASACGSGRRR